MDTMTTVILQDVSFSFKKDSKPFFQNVSVEFLQGSINFVCGKNGVGKSTLFKILSGKTDADHHVSGFLSIDGKLFDLSINKQVEHHVAMVLQNFNSMLVDNYSFHENLQFALMPCYPGLQNLPEPLPLPTFVEKYKIIYDMPIHLLSGGQRQILAILMVLQRHPRILLLDEPTAALDEENARIVMDFLQDLAVHENITIIAIVHNHELVKQYAAGSYFELYDNHSVRSVRAIQLNEI